MMLLVLAGVSTSRRRVHHQFDAFDDFILTIKSERGAWEKVSLLQAKHNLIETKTITFSNLLLDDEKKMNLKVYFNSF